MIRNGTDRHQRECTVFSLKICHPKCPENIVIRIEMNKMAKGDEH